VRTRGSAGEHPVGSRRRKRARDLVSLAHAARRTILATPRAMFRDWRQGVGFLIGLWIACELFLPLLGPR
jgi:hypothetical protein